MQSNSIIHLGLYAFVMHLCQTGLVLADQNISNIQQIGSGNTVAVTQNTAPNTKNTALVEQDGDDHKAEIEQTGTGLVNDASIYQSGLSHTASIFQSGVGGSNEAIITQDGESNEARISQQALLAGLNPNLATITQNGTGNNAEISQNGNNHDAEIKQNGNYNAGRIVQNNKGQKAYLEQNGDNLTHPTITQYGAGAEVIVIQTQ